MTDPLDDEIRASLKPYRGRVDAFARLPERGRARADVLTELADLAEAEREAWLSGHASGAVYHGDPEHMAFLSEVYAAALAEQPAARRPVAERDEVRGRDRLDDGGACSAPDAHRRRRSCGTVTSGGTESILLAMKAYRDQARARGIAAPEMVAPVHRARGVRQGGAQYFGIELVRVPVGADMRADVAATARRDHRRTVVVVGSAPCFPHGVDRPDRGAGRAGAPAAASASTPTPAWAASCCRGRERLGYTCRRSTSGCPA